MSCQLALKAHLTLLSLFSVNVLFTNGEATLYFFVFVTYIIAEEVRMIFLNAVVQDRHNYTSSRVALSPCYSGVQVLMCWGGLEETQGFCSAVSLP